MVKSLTADNNHSSATNHPNVSRRPYGTWVEGEGSTIIPKSGLRNTLPELSNKGGNPEYLNQ